MKRFRAWMPLAALFVVFISLQGVYLLEVAPDSRDDIAVSERLSPDSDGSWSWSEFVRDDGPWLERIPAPYVVLTILGGAAVTAIAWFALVRWTDISEAW